MEPEKKSDKIGEYLSLQELGAVIDKIGFQSVLPKSDRLPAEKGCLYQIHNPIKDEEAEKLEKEANENHVTDKVSEDSTIKSPHTASQDEIAAPEVIKNPWIPISRKTAEKIALALLMCVISATIILPFFLLFGNSIKPISSSVSYDYDETCDNTKTNTTPDAKMYGDMCLAYGNGVCDTYLMSGGLTNITTLRSVIVSEQDVAAFFLALDTYTNIVTKECREATKPFICRYIFPPCDSNGGYQFITKDECLNLQHVVCASEWIIALSIAPELVPDCEQLNNSVAEDFNQSPGDSQQLNFNSSNANHCPEDFGAFCNNTKCLPLCSQFSQYNKITTTVRKSIDIFVAALAIIGGILSIILTVIRRKKMLEFPAIYTLYMTLCPMVVAVLILITHIDTEKDLYCPYETLVMSYENPSAFCQLSGGIFQFCLILMTMFWIFHLIHIFLKVVFPVKSLFLTTRRWNRGLHITEVLASFFISALGPGIVHLSGIKYGFAFFPPLLCLPASNVFLFYAMAVPLVVIMTLGLNVIAVIIWTLFSRKSNVTSEGNGRRKCSISTPEVKVIILLMYFLLFGLITSIYTGTTIMDAPLHIDNLYAYLVCQLRGDNPACRKFQDEYLEHQSPPHLTSTVFIMMGLINWVNLLFVVQYQDIKQIAAKISKVFYHHTRPTTKCTLTNGSSCVTNSSIKSTHSHVETEV